MMHSPLPDSTTLEAGILEDSPPSRLSRVQDNVRNLLRSSMLASVRSSPRAPSVIASPELIRPYVPAWHPALRETMPSPTESTSSTESDASHASKSSRSSQRSTDMLMPQRSFQQAPHHSVVFNSRALTALNHPDLSHPSLASIIHSEAKSRQRPAWTRTRHRRAHSGRIRSSWLICVALGLALAGLVATYVALATTINNVSVGYHVIFVIGILLIGIAFIHTLARLLIVPHKSRSRHHRSGKKHKPRQLEEGVSSRSGPFVPDTPIPVLLNEDSVRPDSREAQPSEAVHQPPEVWVKDGKPKTPMPPPAYGRWRGSVRADPELLHWHSIPAPVEEDQPIIPSPTYEATTAGGASPPSYKTKETPPRSRHGARVQDESEMVEGRGIGL